MNYLIIIRINFSHVVSHNKVKQVESFKKQQVANDERDILDYRCL